WLFVLGLAALVLAPMSQSLADDSKHYDGSGRETPWTNCIGCHGADLAGGFTGVSCFDCHQPFSSPDPPPVGHHEPPGEWNHVLTEPRKDPIANGCNICHGSDLTGGAGPSCFTCHDDLWSGGGGGGGGGNQPPVVNPGGPYVAAPNEVIAFNGSGTYDPDGDTLIYLWSFGDGSQPPFPSQNPNAAHAYKNLGTYTARLTATDGHNTPVIATVQVLITNVVNRPPTAEAGGPYSGTEEQSITLSAAGSSDPDGDTLTYIWSFGDGTAPSLPSQNPAVTHTYQDPGTFTATVTVTDGVNTPVTDTATVNVQQKSGGGGGGGFGEETWQVLIPFTMDEFTVSFDEFSCILLVFIEQTDGSTSFGIGMEFSGMVFWMDVTGALYMGSIDHDAGTMMGLVFGHPGGSSVWFAELL
ncbi:MAG: PKD domain-containing protein, partial [Planctomycetota bacterium]